MARPKAAGAPGPHPEPPPDLARRELPLADSPSTLYRIHLLTRPPEFYGRTRRHRWDAPDAEFGIMYASATPVGAFAETLLPAPGALAAITASISGATVPVSGSMVAGRGWALATPKAPLRCVDLRGAGLARIGADGRLASGPHVVAQRWSRALWSHPSQPDGILYRSRRDPDETSIAVYERARRKIRLKAHGGLKDPRHRAWLAQIYQRYAVAELP